MIESRPQSTSPTASTAEGNRGTSPVLMNSMMTITPGTKASAIKHQAGAAEKGQRFVVAKQREHGVENEKPVAEKLYLGVAAGRAMSQVYGNFQNAKATLDCLNGQFGLDLKTSAKEWQLFDKPPIKRPVA